MANNQIGIELLVVGTAAFSRAMRTAQDDLERTSNAVKKAAGISNDLGSALTALGGNMQRLGRAMLIDVTAPIALLSGALIKAGIQFEDSFAGIGKTVEGVAVGFEEIKAAAQRDLGVTVTTMDEAKAAADRLGMAFGDLTPVGIDVRNQFRQMGLEVPIASNELAELGEVVGQLGVNAPEIAQVTKLIADLGVATDIAAEDAAFGLIRMANIMGSTVGPNAISMEEFVRRAGSALVDLGNKSVATEGEILNFALRLSSAGDLAKMSEQEVLAWATTLADLGARAESGGTAVSRALNEMTISVASGGTNLKIFARVMGMTTEEFSKSFRDNATQTLREFTKALGDGIEAGNVSKGMLTDMGLGGIRAADIMLRLSDATSIFDKNLTNSNKAWAEGIALENEAEKRFGTFKSQIQILKNTFTDLGISIFDLVEGDLKNLLGVVKDALNWFKGLDDGLKRNIIIIGALAAVVGPLLIVFGGLISFLGVIATGISALGVAALPVIAILSALGVAAASAAGVTLFNQKAPPDVVGPQVNSQEQAQQLTKSLPPAPSPVQSQEQAMRRVSALPEMPKPDIQAIKVQMFLDDTGVTETIASLKENITDIFNSVKGLKIPDLIKDSGLLQSVKDWGEFLKDTGIEIFTQAMGNLRRGADSFTESIKPFIENLAPKLTSIFENLSRVYSKLQPLFEALGKLFVAVFGEVKGDELGATLGTLAGMRLDTVISGIEKLTEVLPGFIDKITKGIDSLTNFVNEIKSIPKKASDGFTEFKASVTEGFNNIISSITEFSDNAKNEISKIPGDIQASLDEFFAGILGEDRYAKLQEAFNKIPQIISTVKDKLLLALGDLLVKVSLWWQQFITPFITGWESLKSGIQAAMVPLLTWIQSEWAAAVTILADVWNKVVVSVIETWDKIKAGFEEAIGKISVFMEGLKESIAKIWEDIKLGAILALGLLWSSVKGKIQEFVDGFIGLIDNLYNEIVGNSIIPDLVNEVTGWLTNLKDTGLQIITDFVTGISNLFASIKLPNLSGILSGLTGGGAGESAQTEDTGAGGEEAAPTGNMFSVQQIVALQQAVISLQESWASFGVVVSATLGVVNQTLGNLAGITKNLFTTLAVSFSEGFTLPVTQELFIFNASFIAITNQIGLNWRTVCLGMVRSTLDFMANSLALLGQFSLGAGQIFDQVKDKGQGSINEFSTMFTNIFGVGGTASIALSQFGAKIEGLKPKFASLKSAVAGFVTAMIQELLKICAVANEVEGCVTGSPELKLQHPFELFEKYIKSTDYGNLITKSMALPSLENITTVMPNLQGNTTNIDRSINATVTGLPINTAEDVADTMLRQLRMGEVMQGA